MKSRHLLSLSLLSVVGLTGCQGTKQLYYWGQYEKAIYAGFVKPEVATPQWQIERLEKDLERAKAKGLKANPGLHAQLGLLYLEIGQAEKAAAEWELEKQLFPESAPLMNRMLEKLAPKTTP